MVESYNNYLLSEELFTRSLLNSNSENSNGDSNSQFPTDCFAHAISAALSEVTFVEANYIIVQIYGNNGVPMNRLCDALALFGNFHRYESNQDGNINCAIGAIPNNYGGKHAVKVLKKIGNLIHYQDPQAQYYGSGLSESYINISSCQIYQFD